MKQQYILIIEDSVKDSEILTTLMRTRLPCYNYIHAFTSQEAREKVSNGKIYSLIILDLNLPGDPLGLSTLQFCRQKSPSSLIVIVSGELRDNQLKTLYAMGSVYIVRKDVLFGNFEFEPLISMLSVRNAAFRLGMEKRSSWRTTLCGILLLLLGGWILYASKDTANALIAFIAGFSALLGADASVLNKLFIKKEKE